MRWDVLRTGGCCPVAGRSLRPARCGRGKPAIRGPAGYAADRRGAARPCPGMHRTDRAGRGFGAIDRRSAAGRARDRDRVVRKVRPAGGRRRQSAVLAVGYYLRPGARFARPGSGARLRAGRGAAAWGSGGSAQALQGQDAWHGRLWRRASESRRRRCSGFRPTGRVRMIMVRTKGPQHSDSGVQIWKTSTMQDLNGVFGEQSGYQEGFGWSLIQYRERSAGTTVDREVALLKSGIDEIEGDLRQTGHASEGCHTDRRSLPMSNKVFVVGSRTRRIGERSDCAIARRTGTGAGDPARVTDISRAERSSRSSRTTGMSDLPWSY